MAQPTRSDHLTDVDLSALAFSSYSPDIVRRLRVAESMKHAFLLEALRRAIRDSKLRLNAELANAASEILAKVQAQAPDIAEDILALPHVGFWAADCLSRLHADPSSLLQPPSPNQFGHFATFAAVAALRAGHEFELAVPIHNGVVILPTMGIVQIEDHDMHKWAWVRHDGNCASVTAGSSTVDLPSGLGVKSKGKAASFIPVPRLQAHAYGLTLNAILETSDPFLTQLGQPAIRPTLFVKVWQQRMQDAWSLLTQHYRSRAKAIAAGLTTLVPLQKSATGQSVSASSGWSWGAIALSLPEDGISLAETLVHEFQHLVLSAVEDFVPLMRSNDGQLLYTPWRDDPRSLPGLLQGCYAYLGVTGFWNRLRWVGSAEERLRSEVEFFRGRRAALGAASDLAGSPALTEAGHTFVTRIRTQLIAWEREAVSYSAETVATEIAVEHRLRWRLAYLHPDTAAVDAVARAWLAGAPKAPVGLEPQIALVPAARSLPDNLFRLLEQGYRDPNRLESLVLDQDTADVAFLRANDTEALKGYLARVAKGDGVEAWVGLLLVRRRLSNRTNDWPVQERPELLVAVHERLRVLTGTAPDAEVLIEWFESGPLCNLGKSRHSVHQ